MIENFRIRVFRSVARRLSFSRAAEELLLTQPAVTQQIKALEDDLGVPLFDRGGGRISLTPGGMALLPFADRMKELSEQAVAAVGNAYGQQAGELHLGASQTIAQYLLANLVATFLKSHPKVALTVRSGNSDAMLEALLAREIQLALIEGPEQRKDLHIEPFMEDHMVLVVPAGHEWADHELEVGDLCREKLLMREFGSGSRRVVELALATAGVKAKDLCTGMEFDSNEGLLSAVEAGLGVTFVSRWAVRNQLSLGTLKLARIRGLKLSRNFSMAYPAGPEPVGSVGAFRAVLLMRALDLAPRTTGKQARTPKEGRPILSADFDTSGDRRRKQ
jgi:LysR family transcriptional regulator, transcriptional activator of the cysJI operon